MADEKLVKAILDGTVDKEKDLVGADLSGAELGSADFLGANLAAANLTSANLTAADFTRTNLSAADLTDADLTDVRCVHANLQGANLQGANLRGAKLVEAKLVEANLSAAILFTADLTAADLTAANLTHASLVGASFASAMLGNADFASATLGFSVLCDVDLRLAKNLAKVEHGGPSSLGLDTLAMSGGEISDVFLRGCGVSESFIEYQQSLVSSAIDFYSCFISYSHEDKSFARRLHNDLQALGIRCWLDEHQMKPGDDIYFEVDRGIRLWDKVLLCCSEHSLKSWWVDNEIDTAFEKERKLMDERDGKKVLAVIPLNLDGFLFSEECQTAKKRQLRSRHAADFTGWKKSNDQFEKAFVGVVKALRADEGARGTLPIPKI